MSRVEIVVERPTNEIAGFKERGLNLRPAFKNAIAAWRSLIAEEFATESWRPPSGPPRPWQPTRAFGDEPAPSKTLQRSGSLLDAWMGRGAGAFERVDADSAAFGLIGQAAVIDAVHRGGAGVVRAAQARTPFVQRVTKKMRTFLGLVKGVWLKKTTTQLVTPRRPHATVNPEIRTRMTAIFAAHIAGRPVPERLIA